MRTNSINYLQNIIQIANKNGIDADLVLIAKNIIKRFMSSCGYISADGSISFDGYKKFGDYVYVWDSFFSSGIKKQEKIPQDLFEITQKRKNIFSKKSEIVIARHDIIETLNLLLQRNNPDIIELFNQACDTLLGEIKANAKDNHINKIESMRKLNQQKRGDFYQDKQYTSPSLINIDKICLVHATRFYPKKNKKGGYTIETTAHATDYIQPRATVHFTCNHIVESHLYGNWDDAPYVVIAPLSDIIALNGKPRRFSAVDTFFLPDPDEGMQMPNSTMIVAPSDKMPADKLYILASNNHAYYRTKNFSEEMRQKLLMGDKTIQYSDMNEEKINSLLINKSRDLATQKLIEQNGFEYIKDNYRGIASSETFLADYYRTGIEHGMFSSDNKYAHATDSETMIDGKYYGTQTLLISAMDGEPIYSYYYQPIKTWLSEHVLQDVPSPQIDVNTKETKQMQKVAKQFNDATEKLRQDMRKKIKTPQDLEKLLASFNWKKY